MHHCTSLVAWGYGQPVGDLRSCHGLDILPLLPYVPGEENPLFLLLTLCSSDAILVGWTSKNSNNVGTRSVSAAMYNVRHPRAGADLLYSSPYSN